MSLSRRTLLAGTAAAAAAAAIGVPSKPTRAAAPLSGKQAPGFYRYKVGSYEITAINDGWWLLDLNANFVPNAQLADVQKAFAEANVPPNKYAIPFTSLVVNTGSKLVLLDTGTGGRHVPTTGTWSDNFAAAGFKPDQVDIIAISHFHPDHINGIWTKDDKIAFPNAEIMVPAPEFAHWMDDGRMNQAPQAAQATWKNTRRVMTPIAGKVTRFDPGKEIAPGVTSIAAYGHTPGHTAFAIASGNQSLLAISDSTNHPALFVRNPDWQFMFDTDRAMAVENRKRLLDRAAADKMQVAGFHWPFPATGFVVKEGSGYRLHPVAWSNII
jgi:glyoxylase-like metal-dependent hydrolase (beta-lactamase superfamily II)